MRLSRQNSSKMLPEITPYPHIHIDEARMKQKIYLALVILLITHPLSLLADIPEPRRINKRFVVAVHEWPPFASRSTRYFGILPRITTEILETQGVAVDFRFLPWADALDGLVTEEFDAALIWVMEDLKSDSFLMSETLLNYRSGLYYRKDMPAPTKEDDLLGFTIGLNPHYVYDASSYQLMKSREMVAIRGDTDQINFQYLLDGQVDFFLTPLLTSKPLLQKQFTIEQQAALEFTTALFQFPPSKLLINRHRDGSEEFIQDFNKGLKRLRNNGTLDLYIDDLRLDNY